MLSKDAIKHALVGSIGMGLDGQRTLQGFWRLSSSRETFGAEVDAEGIVIDSPIARYIGRRLTSVTNEMLSHPGEFHCERF